MKSIYVVDCSFVAAFFLQEKEGTRFEKLLLTSKENGEVIQVPALFELEIFNVFLMAMRQGRITREAAREMRLDLAALGIESQSSSNARSLETIFELADRHDLTCYEAAYLELAIRRGGKLKTLDRDLLKLQKVYPWISNA